MNFNELGTLINVCLVGMGSGLLIGFFSWCLSKIFSAFKKFF